MTMPVYADLAGRGVLISGGASGIGADMVRAFAAQGARVAFLDIDLPAGAALARETGARFLPCDVTDLPALAASVRSAGEAGGLAVLVNNAANDTRHDWTTLDPDGWEAIVAVNLRHMLFATQAALPFLRAGGGGSVVNMGSAAPELGVPRLAAYSACKAAVRGLTRSLARELGPEGIRVNAIVPGAILTERQLRLWITPEDEARILGQQCLKRRLTGPDVAAMALFLASSASAGCTSQDFVVDGGLT